ncbi:hypothetical protein SAMN05446927_8482 [Caballeronia arationis]|jgi:hypothetical protein|uniref:Uncharacterized protein n=1 Tax=Caballeronia arationis TaxID=1777142 RepID=A0A7Z7N7C1_9BURK|nr:hypothetical protein SAMN05446927_8482 [Caballeronia arationis]
MSTVIFVSCMGALLTAYTLWSARNGQRRDRERDWSN